MHGQKTFLGRVTSSAMHLVREQGFGEFVRHAGFRLLAKYAAPLWKRRSLAALRGTSKPGAARTIIIVGTLDWAYPFQQRPHHLARALARLNFRVVYVSPGHGRDRVFTVREVEHGILLTSHRLEAICASPSPLVYIVSTDVRSLSRAADETQQAGGKIIYDYLDHLDSTISNGAVTPAFEAVHRRILSDEEFAFVIASADSLHEEVSACRSENHALVTNGVDARHFHVERDETVLSPAMRDLVGRNQPLIGFFGALASWVDVGLMIEAAKSRPQYQFVLIGPVLVSAPAVIDRPLPDNLSILGPLPYEQLPGHAAFFDVLTIPFFLNSLTEATSPLKLFEYMALGRPIVSTPIRECLKYQVVQTAGDAAAFVAEIDRALELGKDDQYRAAVRGIADQNSWDEKAKAIQALLETDLGDRAVTVAEKEF